MQPSRLLVRALALGLSVTLAPALATSTGTAPAHAVVQPCTVSYSAEPRSIEPKGPTEGHSWNPFEIRVTDTRVVADLDVWVDLAHPDANVSLHVLSPQTSMTTLQPSIQTYNGTATTGAMNGMYVFDDEAAQPPISGANPAPGRYQPASPSTALEGHPAVGVWSMWILNRSTSRATLRALTFTFTFATCDSDGDDIEDKVDNCPTIVNNQINTDGDTVGDACDPDDDSDGRIDTLDGCRIAAAPTATGCPTASRTAGLEHKKRKDRLAITIASLAPACEAATKVTLMRKLKGADRRLTGFTTNSTGHYRIKAPRKAGRYYVKARASYAPGAAECGADSSPTVRIRHP